MQDFNKKRLASDDSSTPDYTVGIFQSIGFKEFHDYLLLGVQEQGCPLGNNFFELCHLKFNCIEYNQFLYFRPETFQRRQRSNDVSHPTVRQKTSEVDSPTIFEKWDRSAMSSSLWSKFQFLIMYRICMLMYANKPLVCVRASVRACVLARTRAGAAIFVQIGSGKFSETCVRVRALITFKVRTCARTSARPFHLF